MHRNLGQPNYTPFMKQMSTILNLHKLKQWAQNNAVHGENSRERSARDMGFAVSRALIQPDYSRLWGTDISPWDGNVRLYVTQSFGAKFTYIKAIDGTLTASYFVDNRKNAADAKYPVGPYGWLYRDANVSCVRQAQAYNDLMQRYPCQLVPAIDFEPTYWGGVRSDPTFADLRKWVTEWLRQGNKKPVLYSAAYFMNTYGAMPSDLKDMFAGLWVAHYGTNTPTLPYGYAAGEWLIHQFSSSGDAAKLSPNSVNKLELDLNYAKDAAALAKIGVTSAPVPPTIPKEGTMLIYVNKVTTASLNGRSGAGTNFPVVAGFVNGDILVCDNEQLADGAYWRRVRACVRSGANLPVPANCWASDSAAGTLQGELASFDVPSVDLSALSVHGSISVDLNGTRYTVLNAEMVKE